MENRFFKKTFSSLVDKWKKLTSREEDKSLGDEIYLDSPAPEAPEPQPEPQPEPTKYGKQLSIDDVPENSDAPADGDDADDGEDARAETPDACERIIGFNEETGNYLVVHYRRGFEARLIQANPEIKNYYSAIKNALLSYEGTKSRLSWTSDNFHNGRRQVAKINVKTGLLVLYFAIDPAELEGTVYRGRNVSDKKKYGDTPFEYKVRSERKLKWALELVGKVSENLGLTKNEAAFVDYAKQYGFESTEELVNRGLIKENITEESPDDISPELLRREGNAPEAAVQKPEKAPEPPKPVESAPAAQVGESAPATLMVEVDIDRVEGNFRPHDVVNLATLKAKSLIPATATALKITSSSGEALPKPLTVEAERFTVEAVRAISFSDGDAFLLQPKKN